MNNEEKILAENENPTENHDIKRAGPKLSKGALIGIIGGAVAVVIVAVILIVALGGKKCKSHVDADDDYKCDSCGVNFDDGDEAPAPTGVQVTFTVKLDNGSSVSGVKFTLSRGEKSYTLTSGADGNVTQLLDLGAYSIEYDYESLPTYCSPDTFGFKVEEGTTEVTLTIVDNQPDGSANKPFFISENETEITLAPGQEIYYNYRGSTEKYVFVYNSGAVINYNNESFAAVDGIASTLLKPEAIAGKVTSFSIKNNTDAEFTATMELIAPLGAMENPIVLSDKSGSASVTPEQIVHYRWTADKAGVLVLTSSTARNSISLTKILENDISIITQTDGSSAAYISVAVGDVINLAVSVLQPSSEELKVDPSLATTPTTVEFAFSIYAGTEAEPVPVLKSELDVSIAPDSSVVFSLDGYSGKSISIPDEENVTLTHGGTDYTPDTKGEIKVALASGLFTVTNNHEYHNNIVIKVLD